MKKEQKEIKEIIENEKLIVREINKDERKIKIVYVWIIALFIIVIAGFTYFLSFQIARRDNPNIADKIIPSPTSVSGPSPTAFLQPSSQPSLTPITTTKNKSIESSVKEYFISFGSGSSKADDWTDVSGMQAGIDFGNYQNIKEIRFEVSIDIPTGNQSVSVRLFNVTDKHPVWNSDVETANSGYVVSNPIIYDVGSKVYRVQAKTQLQSLANITQARLHIILQ